MWFIWNTIEAQIYDLKSQKSMVNVAYLLWIRNHLFFEKNNEVFCSTDDILLKSQLSKLCRIVDKIIKLSGFQRVVNFKVDEMNDKTKTIKSLLTKNIHWDTALVSGQPLVILFWSISKLLVIRRQQPESIFPWGMNTQENCEKLGHTKYVSCDVRSTVFLLNGMHQTKV